jgi:hypothetical protein
MTTTTRTSNSACLSPLENKALVTSPKGRVVLLIGFSTRQCLPRDRAKSKMFALYVIKSNSQLDLANVKSGPEALLDTMLQGGGQIDNPYEVISKTTRGLNSGGRHRCVTH